MIFGILSEEKKVKFIQMMDKWEMGWLWVDEIFELSIRLGNCLRRNNIVNFEDLYKFYSKGNWYDVAMEWPGFGKRCLEELTRDVFTTERWAAAVKILNGETAHNTTKACH